MDRLAVFKALGDNTRYAIYLELARSPMPLSTGDVSESLGLHPNTVRPHLERMRDVGLLQVETDSRGHVGRPQHRYSLHPDAPSLGLEPSPFPVLARMLSSVAASMAPDPDAVAAAAFEQGREASARHADEASCVAALVDELAELGFDPAAGTDGRTATIVFTHCPFRELAEAHPEIVCNLHRGMIQGFVERWDEVVVSRFGTLADRDPCQVELANP